MTEECGFSEIYQSKLLQHTLHILFGIEPIEVISRSASYIMKQTNEPGERIKRILLLPPGGYTANSLTETNSHPEARYAKITVKGGKTSIRLALARCAKRSSLRTIRAVMLKRRGTNLMPG